ncbi:hypothetical protein, partial [Cronobacter sakazakii]|uniref:hypothetical protein n=1 Tax=Cronobacter sakazakii TaxID=28141 RepID=UPI001EFCA873
MLSRCFLPYHGASASSDGILFKGLVLRNAWWGKLPAVPLRWRLRGVMAALF